MKKILFAALLGVASFNLQAQINIGSASIPTRNAGKIDKDTYQRFKNTTTIITLQNSDYKQLAAYQKAISEVWTVTKFKIVKPDELNNYINNGDYSFFSFGGYVVTTTKSGSSVSTTNPYFCYDLWLPEIGKKGKVKQDFLARMFLHVEMYAYQYALQHRYQNKMTHSEGILSYLYNENGIYGFTPGLLKGYLKEINDALQTEQTRSVLEEIEDKTALSSLAKDTLYIPDYVYLKAKLFAKEEKMDDEADAKLAESYPYPAKIVTTQELDKMIADNKSGFKYLTYSNINGLKFINVYDSKSNKMIYNNHVTNSRNFKNKDLVRLAKLVK